MKRESMVFYNSWLEATANLPREIQGEVLTAIIEYGLNGETTGSLKPIAKAMLAMVIPQIDANNKKYENGCKGGAPVGNTNNRYSKKVTEVQPKVNQDTTKVQPSTTEVQRNDNDICNMIYKENTSKEVSKKDKLSSTDKIDYIKLKDYFNSIFKDKLPQINSIDKKRQGAIRARVAEHGKESIDKVLKNVLQSSFLLGGNDKNWHTDFDWIFKPTNYTKILEGNYGNSRSNYTSKQEANDYAMQKYIADRQQWEQGIPDEVPKPF